MSNMVQLHMHFALSQQHPRATAYMPLQPPKQPTSTWSQPQPYAALTSAWPLPDCLNLQVGITQGLLTGLSLGSLNLVLFSAYAASLYYGATRVAAGSMSGGDVLAVMMAALLGAYSLGQAAPLLQFFLAGRSAAGRLTAIDKLQPGIDVDAEGLVPAEVAGELRLQGVSFVYPSLRVQVLDQLDLHIPAGWFGGCVACLENTGGLASQWNA